MTHRPEINRMLVSFASKIEQWRYPLDFLRRIDFRNLRGFRRAVTILARPSVADWWYDREYTFPELARAAKNFVFDPGEMNVFQQHSPEAGYTSTPEDGLLAGVTAHGRLSSIFYPHTGFTQQIPYTQTGHGKLNGSKPRDGAFLGYRGADGVHWLWESQFSHEMSPVPETGMVHVQYESDAISVDEYTYVVPTTETLARDFSITNRGTQPIRNLVYYMQANANDNGQYPIYNSNRNHATAGNELQWEDCESDVRLRVFPAHASVTDSGVADAPLATVLADGSSQATGRHLGGYLELDVSIQPGEQRTVTVFTTGSTNGDADATDGDDDEDITAVDIDDSPLDLSPARRREFTRGKWNEYLDPVETDSVPSRYAEQYVRSVIGISMLYDPASGSISASPNSQPTYYLSWPRDGSFIAIALAEVGLTDIAKDYLVNFCGAVQEQDGSFEQCYGSTGEPMGIIAVENDQQTIYPHAVRTVYELTSDQSFLREVWPVVERAADYTVGAIVDNGLLAATHDFAEMWTDARQSIWTNAFAYRGLLDAASLAERVEANDAAERYRAANRYRDAARGIGDAVERRLFETVDGGFATHLSISGAEREENAAFSVAIHPTKWAERYGHVEELFDAFGSFSRSSTERWLPCEFMYAAALYNDGRIDDGDAILDDLGSECLPGGTLAETVDEDGNHQYAALGWSNAAFIHALHERSHHCHPE